jgi:phage baseplate assembly protein W
MDKRQLPNSLNKATAKDFDLSFRRHPSTGKLLTKKGDESVKQALKNLLLTNRYERPFRPQYGGDVRKRLFDNMNSILPGDYEAQIVTAIENYDPRIILGPYSVTVYENQQEDNTLNINVVFRCAVTLNDISLDINLNRVR